MWLYVTNMLRKLKWETPGVFQAAFALADAVREDLGENANVLSEKQLGDVLAKKQGISSEHIRKRRSIQMDGLRRRGSESSF
jgi:DNA polymerase I-like protein with 3'-5' exonuclease and polymerase domains